MSDVTAPILIMAGGTGGHIFPALAVARELRGRDEEVVWLGTKRGLEAEIIPKEGFPLEWTRVSGLRGKGLLSWLLAPLKLSVAVFDALVILIRRRPKVVLGMGGKTGIQNPINTRERFQIFCQSAEVEEGSCPCRAISALSI